MVGPRTYSCRSMPIDTLRARFENTRALAWAPATLALLSLPVAAQQAAAPAGQAPDFQACSKLTDDKDRLACYDRQMMGQAMLALPASPVAAQAETAQPGQPAQTVVAPSGGTPATGNTPPDEGFLSRFWELSPADKRGTFNYTAYRPNFFLPIRGLRQINQNPSSPSRGVANNLPKYQHLETKLQISLRTKVMEDFLLPNADLWVAYTQQSTWQTWNHEESSPFRNTDYQPEVLYVVPMPTGLQNLPFDWKWRLTSFGLVHQSNGQSDELSRSWNRAYVSFGVERGGLNANLRVEAPLAKSNDKYDDNPDIEHYLGHVQAQINWSPGKSIASLLWRPSFTGRGSVELNWSYPVNAERPDGLRWYVQAFHGFGETLLDYNFKQTSLGLGLTIFKF